MTHEHKQFRGNYFPAIIPSDHSPRLFPAIIPRDHNPEPGNTLTTNAIAYTVPFSMRSTA